MMHIIFQQHMHSCCFQFHLTIIPLQLIFLLHALQGINSMNDNVPPVYILPLNSGKLTAAKPNTRTWKHCCGWLYWQNRDYIHQILSGLSGLAYCILLRLLIYCSNNSVLLVTEIALIARISCWYLFKQYYYLLLNSLSAQNI